MMLRMQLMQHLFNKTLEIKFNNNNGQMETEQDQKSMIIGNI